MKYGSSKFKGSPVGRTVGPAQCPPRDGDVSQSFMTPESFLCFFPVLLMSSQREPPFCSGAVKPGREAHSLKPSSERCSVFFSFFCPFLAYSRLPSCHPIAPLVPFPPPKELLFRPHQTALKKEPLSGPGPRPLLSIDWKGVNSGY